VTTPSTTRRPLLNPGRSTLRRRRIRAIVGLLIALIMPVAGCSSSATEIKRKRDKADFHYKLALGYFQARNIDLSIRELIKAFEFESEHADSRYLYGFVLFGRKQYEEAAENFRTVLRIRPRFFAARNHLGVTYLALERWQEAVTILKPLLKEPTYTTPYLVHNNIGWAHLKQSDLRNAERHLRMSVFVNPKFCQGHRNLALLAVEQRDLSAAVSHMEDAITRCPKIAEFHFQLGEILTASGFAQRAAKAFAQCRLLAKATVLGRRCAARNSGPAARSGGGRIPIPNAPLGGGGWHGPRSP